MTEKLKELLTESGFRLVKGETDRVLSMNVESTWTKNFSLRPMNKRKTCTHMFYAYSSDEVKNSSSKVRIAGQVMWKCHYE